MSEVNPLIQDESSQPVDANALLSGEDPQPKPEGQFVAPNSADELLGGQGPVDAVHLLADNIGNKFDPKDYYIGEDVEQGGTGFLRATAKKLAANEWGKFKGVERALNVFTIPQDAVGRGLTKIMQWTGGMSDDDAKRMLSQEHVSPSDFLNFFTAKPDSDGKVIMRSGVGLALDMVLDPVMLVSMWGKAAKEGEVIVRGQSVPLSKLSEGERIKVRQADKLDKIIKNDGSIMDIADLKKADRNDTGPV